jgi:hypothetical protein
MFNKDRIGKECFAEFIPWCHKCGSLLDVDLKCKESGEKVNSDGYLFVMKCNCGEVCEMEAMIVYTNKSSKRSEE